MLLKVEVFTGQNNPTLKPKPDLQLIRFRSAFMFSIRFSFIIKGQFNIICSTQEIQQDPPWSDSADYNGNTVCVRACVYIFQLATCSVRMTEQGWKIKWKKQKSHNVSKLCFLSVSVTASGLLSCNNEWISHAVSISKEEQQKTWMYFTNTLGKGDGLYASWPGTGEEGY